MKDEKSEKNVFGNEHASSYILSVSRHLVIGNYSVLFDLYLKPTIYYRSDLFLSKRLKIENGKRFSIF
jgi:hypothetical protein